MHVTTLNFVLANFEEEKSERFVVLVGQLERPTTTVHLLLYCSRYWEKGDICLLITSADLVPHIKV